MFHSTLLLIKRSILLATLLFSFLDNSRTFASEVEADPQALETLNLEDLLKVRIQGASREKKSLLDSAAIVTVITAEDIQRSGARDINDILNLVPGIELATDNQSINGIVVRGMWANEGKVLLLIDGEEMNEIGFSSVQVGHRYPPESIERVEVIRGPGSAAYGGFAELAVINIISKNAEALKGGFAQIRYGQTASTFSERDISLGYGKQIGDWSLSGFFSTGQAQQSDRNYTDTNGRNLNFNGTSNRDPIYFNLGASNDSWSFRFIYDRYNLSDQSAYGAMTPMVVHSSFETVDLGINSNLILSDRVTLLPEIHLKQQRPWAVSVPDAVTGASLYYDVTFQQAKLGLSTRMELDSNLIFYVGYMGEVQQALDAQPGGNQGLFPNGLQSFSLFQNSAFTEINWNTPIANFTLGGRYQSQNYGGVAFVPRVSAVREWDSFHIKALYSGGFREPGLENLRINPALVAEKTQVAELEFGKKIGSDIFTTLNIFDITLNNPIIFNYYSMGINTYQNFPSAGNYGLEYDFRIKKPAYSFDLNYSYFHAKTNEPIDYEVNGQPDTLLGVANHKIVLSTSFRVLSERDHLSLTETFLSTREGYDYDANSPTGVSIHSFKPVFLTNLFFEHSDFLVKNLSLGLGVFNVLNQDYRLIQPYDGGYPPVPVQSRDWVAQLSYRANLE